MPEAVAVRNGLGPPSSSCLAFEKVWQGGPSKHPANSSFKASCTISGYRDVGKLIYRAVSKYAQSHPEVKSQCLQAIGSADPGGGPKQRNT